MGNTEASFRREIEGNGWQTRVGASVVTEEVGVEPVVIVPYDGTETETSLPIRVDHQVNPDRADLPA